MATTKDFGEVIRRKLEANPELKAAVEREIELAKEEQRRFDAMTPEEQQRYMDEN